LKDDNNKNNLSKKYIFNRIQAIIPLTGLAFGVFFLGEHISLKNRTYRPLLIRSMSSFKGACVLIYLIVLPFECNGSYVLPYRDGPVIKI
jgi:hypothetical protein